MTFEVDVADRTRVVSIERVAGHAAALRVTVDGRAEAVDARVLGDGRISIRRGARVHEVSVVAGEPGELQVRVAGVAVRVGLNRTRARRPAFDAAAGGAARVVAPMAGRVLRVLVGRGDEVAARQPLVVIEAMKMENALASPKVGRVAEIAVTDGASVEAGRLLLVIE